jgi:hypothetical protein
VPKTIYAPQKIVRKRTRIVQPPKYKIKISPFLIPSREEYPSRNKLRIPSTGFTFKIRRKGKFGGEETPFAFTTPEEAEAFAQEKVLGEAAASYKLVKAKAGKKIISTGIKPTKNVFFRPGKTAGVKVQKTLLRITTPGEKREISYVGAVARKTKSRSRKKGGTLNMAAKKKSTKKKKR